MYTLYKMLALRNKHSEVLLRGQYIPLEVTGPKHQHLIVSWILFSNNLKVN